MSERPRPANAVPNIPYWVPSQISGRDVTNRGVHWLPFGFHYVWMRTKEDGIKKPMRKDWEEFLVAMNMSWVVLITTGDSVVQVIDGKTPVEMLLDIGVIPIIRDDITFPRHFNNMATLEKTVEIYARYGLKPPWIIGNEPLDGREWKNEDVPPYDEAMQIVADVWGNAANIIVKAGGVIGFPDGPGYAKNPFELLRDHIQLFADGDAFYTAHAYGKGRDRDYPYDDVTHLGVPLTEEEYVMMLDDYADDPQWREESLEMINASRFKNKNPKLTALTDDVCFRAWERILYRSRETFGFEVPIMMTEGGWAPRDRAGTGPNTDIRWPHTTPNMAAKKTLAMYKGNSPYFAMCPWLAGDDAMQIHGYTGWPFDSWAGFAYSEKYGYYKPVRWLLEEIQGMSLEKWAAQQCNNIIYP